MMKNGRRTILHTLYHIVYFTDFSGAFPPETGGMHHLRQVHTVSTDQQSARHIHVCLYLLLFEYLKKASTC